MITTYVDILRHGEPEGGNVFRGRTDHALTKLGQWQVSKRLCGIQTPWQQVLSSPLTRCLHSAKECAETLGVDLYVDERWRELDYGAWENQPVATIFKHHSVQAQQLWQDPMAFCAPDGEPVFEFQQRVLEAWDDLLKHQAGKHCLVFTHGGVMRVLLQAVLQLAPTAMSRLSLPYASWLRIRIDQQDKERFYSLERLDGSALLPPEDAL